MSTKDTVLALFEKNKGFYVSGEKIASDLNISRTAVWKAVKKLQSEGYEIKAVTNRGYCLDKESDVLTAHGIRSFLGDEYPCLKPEVFVTVDSTNNVCRAKAEEGEEEGYVAVAGAQTSGRGRRGRSFYSPAGSGIYMSILLRPEDFSEKQVLQLTTMAAVAVSAAVEKVSGKTAGIKWVNDILIEGKKVCGILTEAITDFETGQIEYLITGIGINTSEKSFPEDLKDIAGSVSAEGLSGHEKALLAAAVVERFLRYTKDLSGFMDSYRSRSMIIGKEITVYTGTYRKDPTQELGGRPARALGIGDDGALEVMYTDGSRERLRSGEVSIRI